MIEICVVLCAMIFFMDKQTTKERMLYIVLVSGSLCLKKKEERKETLAKLYILHTHKAGLEVLCFEHIAWVSELSNSVVLVAATAGLY